MKYIAPVASVLAAALAAFVPEIQGLIAAHPALAGLFAGLAALVAAFAPQPHQS